jgi:DNA-binding TFAR19-related protein (PDSD5 family)
MMASRAANHQMEREAAMKDAAFQTAFDNARERLRRMSVAFIEIQNALELHLFELYCAMELGTGEWNTFRTH